MNSSAAYVASVALFTLLLCSPGVAQLESSAESQDGTQRGSIQISEDSTTTRGSVSSSSVGVGRASAFSSLTIGPTGTQASFAARGDDQSVSRTVVTGEPGATDTEDTSSPTKAPEADAVSTASAQSSVVTPETIKEDKEAENSEVRAVVPKRADQTESDEDSEHKKVCIIDDQEEFERQLDLGIEVTHVKAHGDDVEIITERRTNYGATRTSLVTRYIPDNIHEECGVTYADLGLEDREGEGYSSLSSSQSAGYHYSASSATDSPRSADYIRQSVLESLCSQDFFRNFALYNECSTYPTKQPW